MNTAYALPCLYCETLAISLPENVFQTRTDAVVMVPDRSLPNTPQSGTLPEMEGHGMLAWILFGSVIVLLIASLPTWPHTRNWGYLPSSSLGLVLLFLIGMLVIGSI